MAISRRTLCLALPILLALVGDTEGGSCTNRKQYYWDGSFKWREETLYCSYGCCGGYESKYCCIDNSVAWVWVIVGSVIGVIMLVALIITLVCVCKKRAGSRGQVIQPPHNPAPVHTVVTYGANGTLQPYYPPPPVQGN